MNKHIVSAFPRPRRRFARKDLARDYPGDQVYRSRENAFPYPYISEVWGEVVGAQVRCTGEVNMYRWGTRGESQNVQMMDSMGSFNGVRGLPKPS